MPNKRGAGQVFIGLQATVELLRDLDRARGLEDRSRFIRSAIVEKLQRMGFRIPKKFIYPPDRTRVVQVHNGVGRNYSLNEDPPPYRAAKKGKKLK